MNAKTINLKFMPYAQAHVNVYPESKTRCLISYRTRVAELTDDGWLYIEKEATCSRTIGRHVTAFLKEYAPHLVEPYRLAKDLAHDHMAMNIHTGELKEWTAA